MTDNGNPRMDRVEATLDRITERMDRMSERMDRMIEHHEQEFKNLMTWQVLTQRNLEDLITQQKHRDEQIDARIDKLVSAIGALIQRLPPTPTDTV